jgi:hypothetical protein
MYSRTDRWALTHLVGCRVSCSGRLRPMASFQNLLLAVIPLAFLAGVLALIYKGSRPLQPVPEDPTPPKKAAWASLIAASCGAALCGTCKGLDLYLQNHLVVSRQAAAVLLVGILTCWCVGAYFSYRAARTANKTLRAIGSVELLTFLLAVAAVLVSRG